MALSLLEKVRILATPIRHRPHLEVLALIVAAALVALGGGEQSGKRKNVQESLDGFEVPCTKLG